ncbi:zinc ribbon domain-containing protein [Desulfonatronum sp. SC1]|uniref:FmdB family zinc ribbon protein n=1 Tax=Desulfonatronum sp. SC1 TaxID=2109626 RepID=UPI000D301C10|nr:zinc ribbon domain-containing protein [Desulfonatronum sp. SC1]PTN33067.1 zinc ribbon domain-containing protein [Desulfonatronum sp. SC1]
MPIFEYACPQCNHVFEDLARLSDQDTKLCPKCGKGRAEKILSVCRASTSGRSSEASSNSFAPSSGCAPGKGFS